jgi:hypothetical protein
VKRLLALAAVGFAFTASAAPAQAALIFFGDRASFNAATTGRTVVDFEGIAPDGSFTFFPAPPGVTLSGANFSISRPASNGNLFGIGDNFYYTGNSVLSSQQSTATNDNVQVTLPGGFTAVGLDYGSFFGPTFTFTLSTGESFTRTAPVFAGLSFIGVVSTVPITSLTVSAPPGDVVNIDNFTFGQAVVPEPATLAVFGALAAGALGLRRRVRKAA